MKGLVRDTQWGTTTKAQRQQQVHVGGVSMQRLGQEFGRGLNKSL